MRYESLCLETQYLLISQYKFTTYSLPYAANNFHTQLDFWKEPTAPGGQVDFLVKPDLREQIESELKSGGYEFTVLIPDVQYLIDQEKRGLSDTRRVTPESVAEFDYSVYHPAEEVRQDQLITLVSEI